MNRYENIWIIYYEIHRQDRTGFTPAQSAHELAMDARTIKKYLAMDEKQFAEHQEKQNQRTKKLEKYESFIKQRLELCPQASAAQVHDWLKERYPDFENVSEKTVYNFVLHVREKFKIIKEFEGRDYIKVPELPYGKQAQVDFGEYNMTDMEGLRKKVYFFAIILSRSRYKYVFFSNRPIKTSTGIEGHEKGFAFFGGYPEEVVYDQDKTLLSDENKGDFILTDAFRAYQQHRKFNLRFCRKSDPESKGKVENLIKYIKYNFLRGRTFIDIDILNSQALEWLDRTANAKQHSTTKLIPAHEWQKEKMHLVPLSVPFLISDAPLRYKVRKDNTVIFKGNYYSVPAGTYKGSDTVVYLTEENETLIIDNDNKEEIARHKVSHIKGILVSNSNHRRDSSIKIREYIELVAEKFSDHSKAVSYLEKIREMHPRYARDQIKIIQAACDKYYLNRLDAALEYCINNQIYKAVDFEPVILSLNENQKGIDKPMPIHSLNEKYRVIPQKTNISDYNQILN